MGTSNGLTVKFSSRGRTHTQKDFRAMSDEILLDMVLVFASSLPWKNERSKQDTFTMLGIASKSIKERMKGPDLTRKDEAEPQGEGRAAA